MNYSLLCFERTLTVSLCFSQSFYCVNFSANKQLLNEAEHDIKNYPDRGQCYLPKPKARGG